MYIKECIHWMNTDIKEPTCYLYMHENFLKRVTRNWLPSGGSSWMLGLQGDTLHTFWILNHVNGLPIKEKHVKEVLRALAENGRPNTSCSKLFLPQVLESPGDSVGSQELGTSGTRKMAAERKGLRRTAVWTQRTQAGLGCRAGVCIRTSQRATQWSLVPLTQELAHGSQRQSRPQRAGNTRQQRRCPSPEHQVPLADPTKQWDPPFQNSHCIKWTQNPYSW